MAQQQNNIQIAAPGFAGLNTQDSPVGMDLSYAATANNCVIDKSGRISSRKGQVAVTIDPDTAGNMDVNPVETAYEYVQADGTRTLLLAGDNDSAASALWNQDTVGNLTTVTGLSATNNNWSFTSLSDNCYMAQAGEDVMITAGATVAAMTEQPVDFGTSDGLVDPNIILSAFGHLWVADGTNNKSTVQWSVITTDTGLGATPWSGSGAGLLNVEEYWPNGSDEIVALAAHNNLLVIFGRRSILTYNVPVNVPSGQGPEYSYLQDTIENIGCIARDSVVSIGTDLLFLDASGVRSLNRTIQEKSVPIGDMSMNIRDDLSIAVQGSDLPVRACYSPEEAMYLLFLPHTTDTRATTYVFDTRRPLENGSLRATIWPGRGLRCGLRTDAGKLMLGRTGGLYEYTGGDDVSSLASEDATAGVTFTYLTRSRNFDQPANLKFPKQVDIILIGGASITMSVNWYFDFSETENTQLITRVGVTGDQWNEGVWGTAEWGELGGLISVESVNMWGSGKNVSLGFTGTITESPVSIQELNLQALLGRIV
jgi:hypothetical protein